MQLGLPQKTVAVQLPAHPRRDQNARMGAHTAPAEREPATPDLEAIRGRDTPSPPVASIARVQALQAAAGNAAVARVLASGAAAGARGRAASTGPLAGVPLGVLARQGEDEDVLDAGVPPVAGVAEAPAVATEVPAGAPAAAARPSSAPPPPPKPPGELRPMTPQGGLRGGGPASAAAGGGGASGAPGARPTPRPALEPPPFDGPTIGPAPDFSPQPITPADPSSGIPWESMWDSVTSDTGLNVIRTVFEGGRLIPGAGFYSGLAADGINMWQDLRTIPEESSGIAEGVVVLRSAVNAANNGIGAILTVNQLIQNGLGASVVLAEFIPLTATVNEIGVAGKLQLDAAQFLLDGSMAIGFYAAAQTSSTPEEAAGWQSLVDGYQSNVLTDFLGTANDLIGLGTAGASQSGWIGQAIRSLGPVLKVAGKLGPTMRAVIISLQNVWGSLLWGTEPPAVARTLARQAAGTSVGDVAQGFAWEVAELELRRMKACYQIGDGLVSAAGEAISGSIDDANAIATDLLGGQEPFALVQQLTVDMMAEMRAKLASLAELEALTASGAENAATVRTGVEGVRATIDALAVPDVEISEVDLGEGMLADAGEALIGAGSSVANAGIELVLEQVQAALDQAKSAAIAPLDGVAAEADSIGEFIAAMGEGARIQIGTIEGFIASFEGRIADAENVPEIIEALVNQSLELIGVDAQFSFEDIQTAWNEIGPMLDEAIAYAESRGLTGPPPQAEAAAPLTPMAVAGAPEE